MKSALLTLVLLLLVLPAHAFPARCIGVSDGDTITVLNAESQQIKIRLYGIDSPESEQPHGRKAKQNMSSLVFGKDVEVPPFGQKHYGRMIARVSVGGLDVCEEQLRAGYALGVSAILLNRDKAGLTQHYQNKEPPSTYQHSAASAILCLGGGLGIRTPDTREGMPVFKTGAINQLCQPSGNWRRGRDLNPR